MAMDAAAVAAVEAASDAEEEEEACRVCRLGAREDEPLFHPCKCRGSIKHVHQKCLVDWLEHRASSELR
jgi:E3 ubiquitin-protein ligase DOA10